MLSRPENLVSALGPTALGLSVFLASSTLHSPNHLFEVEKLNFSRTHLSFEFMVERDGKCISCVGNRIDSHRFLTAAHCAKWPGKYFVHGFPISIARPPRIHETLDVAAIETGLQLGQDKGQMVLSTACSIGSELYIPGESFPFKRKVVTVQECLEHAIYVKPRGHCLERGRSGTLFVDQAGQAVGLLSSGGTQCQNTQIAVKLPLRDWFWPSPSSRE